MDSFKQRMQSVVDSMPDGDDKHVLQALIDYQDSMTQSGPPQDRMRAFREVMRAQRRAAMTPNTGNTPSGIQV